MKYKQELIASQDRSELSDNSDVMGDGQGRGCGECRWARDQEQRITYLVMARVMR